MSRATPLVSVVIPTYQSSATVADTIESALVQTLKEIEVVVVDDGSRDDTAAIVEAITRRDPRVRIVQQENRGVAAARNAAIEVARAPTIAPLDSDDLWFPHKLEAQLARLELGGPEMGFVYGWSTVIDAQGRTIDLAPAWGIEGRVLPALVWTHFCGSASSPLFRRSALDEVGCYDPSLRAADAEGCEDWDLVLRVAERFAVGVVPSYVVAYRKVAGSMSAGDAALARSYAIMMGRVQRAHPELPDELFAWSRSRFFAYLSGVSVTNDRFDRALVWMLRAFRHDPLGTLSVEHVRQIAEYLVRIAIGPLRPAPGTRASAWLERASRLRQSRHVTPRVAVDPDRDPPYGHLPWEGARSSLRARVQAARWTRTIGGPAAASDGSES